VKNKDISWLIMKKPLKNNIVTSPSAEFHLSYRVVFIRNDIATVVWKEVDHVLMTRRSRCRCMVLPSWKKSTTVGRQAHHCAINLVDLFRIIDRTWPNVVDHNQSCTVRTRSLLIFLCAAAYLLIALYAIARPSVCSSVTRLDQSKNGWS